MLSLNESFDNNTSLHKTLHSKNEEIDIDDSGNAGNHQSFTLDKQNESEKQMHDMHLLKQYLLDKKELDLPPNITAVLIEMFNKDQEVRNNGILNDIIATDNINQKKINDLLINGNLGIYNWNQKHEIGKYKFTTETLIWIIIQHADADVELQKKFLSTYSNKITKPHYAYLVDRIAVNTNMSQTYATQGYNDNNNRYFRKIEGINIDKKSIKTNSNNIKYVELSQEDIIKIDILRKEYDIQPHLLEYFNHMTKISGGNSDGIVKMLI